MFYIVHNIDYISQTHQDNSSIYTLKYMFHHIDRVWHYHYYNLDTLLHWSNKNHMDMYMIDTNNYHNYRRCQQDNSTGKMMNFDEEMCHLHMWDKQ